MQENKYVELAGIFFLAKIIKDKVLFDCRCLSLANQTLDETYLNNLADYLKSLRKCAKDSETHCPGSEYIRRTEEMIIEIEELTRKKFENVVQEEIPFEGSILRVKLDIANKKFEIEEEDLEYYKHIILEAFASNDYFMYYFFAKCYSIMVRDNTIMNALADSNMKDLSKMRERSTGDPDRSISGAERSTGDPELPSIYQSFMREIMEVPRYRINALYDFIYLNRENDVKYLINGEFFDTNICITMVEYGRLVMLENVIEAGIAEKMHEEIIFRVGTDKRYYIKKHNSYSFYNKLFSHLVARTTFNEMLMECLERVFSVFGENIYTAIGSMINPEKIKLTYKWFGLI